MGCCPAGSCALGLPQHKALRLLAGRRAARGCARRQLLGVAWRAPLTCLGALPLLPAFAGATAALTCWRRRWGAWRTGCCRTPALASATTCPPRPRQLPAWSAHCRRRRSHCAPARPPQVRWQHMAPTAPDTLTCYPFGDDDPFLMRAAPHVYFAGNQPEFASREVQGPAGQRVRLVAVPSFASSGTLVLVNLRTLQCHPVNFGAAV